MCSALNWYGRAETVRLLVREHHIVVAYKVGNFFLMLSKRQFAAATGASTKWVDTAGRLLGRHFSRTEAEARWLGLVRTISQAFDMSLGRAAEIATRALELDPGSLPTTIATSYDGALRIVVDVQRYHSRFTVALAKLPTAISRR